MTNLGFSETFKKIETAMLRMLKMLTTRVSCCIVNLAQIIVEALFIESILSVSRKKAVYRLSTASTS